MNIWIEPVRSLVLRNTPHNKVNSYVYTITCTLLLCSGQCILSQSKFLCEQFIFNITCTLPPCFEQCTPTQSLLLDSPLGLTAPTGTAGPPKSYHVNVREALLKKRANRNCLRGLDLLQIMITNYQLLEGAGPPKSYHVNDTNNYVKGCGVYQ